MTPPITPADFKARFARDFLFVDDPTAGVVDGDITNAINDATLIFNPAMWSGSVELNTAFLMLTAHFLALNVQASGGIGLQAGLENAGGGPIESKSVGPISVTMSFPERWKNSPVLSPFLRTDYGIRYAQMAAPRLAGNIGVVAGFNDAIEPQVVPAYLPNG